MDSSEHKYGKAEREGNELEASTEQHANSKESKAGEDHNADGRVLDRSENSLEDDNWSQQVETDETVHMATSVVMEEMEDSPHHVASITDISSDHLMSPTTDRRLLSASNGLAPKREEPTLKEKLVERERQRRVETERARLKRHFALSSNDVGVPSVESGEPDGSIVRENGSVTATIGEGSSVAFLDDEEGQRLTYPMERFLQDQGAIEEESTREVPRDGGVLMERFLMEPVVVVDTPTASHESSQHIDRSVSFELDSSNQADTALGSTAQTPPEESMIDRTPSDPVAGMNLTEQISANTGVAALADAERRPFPAGSSIGHSFESDEPRVLRLTEAEIQEMAAIDEMSRSNAPPSDRGDISESSFVGELMSDFPAQQLDNQGSQGTGTTEMESASADHSQSGRTMSEHDEGPSINIPGTASVSSNAVSSRDASVAANPPSEIEGDEPILSPIQNRIETLESSNGGADVHLGDHSPLLRMDDPGPPDLLQEPGPVEMRIVNRRIRPGMPLPHNRGALGTPMRRSISAPDNLSFDVSGFDYDKDEGSPGSPLVRQEVQSNDIWSPGSNMSWSPPHQRTVQTLSTATRIPVLPSYSDNSGENEGVNLNPRFSTNQMNTPFDQKVQFDPTMPKKVPSFPQVRNFEADVFHKIRISNSTDSSSRIAAAKQYLAHGSIQRAFPERIVALSIALLLEVPIVFMICGGSDKVIENLGQSEYQLLVSFLPICMAVSGNVGSQASELTVRAIVQGNVDQKSYPLWILKEVGTSAYLGLAMSTLVGLLCIFIGGFKWRFVSIVASAQFLSILSAGLTGSLVPVLTTKVFNEAGNRWNSALVTAIQDLVTSAIMVIMVYKLGEVPGPLEQNVVQRWGDDGL